MDFDAQQPSSSSSSSFSNVEGIKKIEKVVLDNLAELNIQEPLTLDKTEDEKNLQSDLHSESENQDEDEDECLIDQLLPPEMLMKILECLDAKSLAVSRLVSRKWNGMARGILKSRDDVETVFTCRETEDGNLRIGGKTETSEASLNNFMKHFGDSRESPLFTCFRFDDMNAFVFDHADWIKFISDFGQSVKSLKLGIDSNFKHPDEFVILAEKVRHLLLNQLPKLGEFGLFLPCFFIPPGTPAFQNLRLFPTTIQLAHLKVLYLNDSAMSKLTGILTDLLVAAVNLQKIEPFQRYGSFGSVEMFQLLQSLGKLDSLQTVQFKLNADFMSKIQGQPSMPFRLKKLDLRVFYIYETEAAWADASIFISDIFESSEDTLKDLRVTPIGFLPNIQVPKFSKLTNLTILEGVGEVFPSELKLNDVFPILQNLVLQVPWTGFCPHDESQNDWYFSSLSTIVITDGEITKEDILRISQFCPKLKNFTAGYFRCGGERENFPGVAEAIWTHLTKLESLVLGIGIQDPADGFPALDSSFTGFSKEYCIRRHDLVEAKKAAEKQGSQFTSESKIHLGAERKTPSILDLKDLRELKVRYFGFAFKDPLPVPQWMSVIEEFAF